MKLLVCGGRNFTDRDAVFKALDRVRDRGMLLTAVITGGAPGADTLAARWALSRFIPHICFRARWSDLGRAAGPIRNAQMLAEGRPDIAVAFPGGPGTMDMVRRLQQAGIKVWLPGWSPFETPLTWGNGQRS